MVKIHVAVIAILSTLYISTQARNVGQYAEEPMDRMVKINSLFVVLMGTRFLRVWQKRCFFTNFFDSDSFSQICPIFSSFAVIFVLASQIYRFSAQICAHRTKWRWMMKNRANLWKAVRIKEIHEKNTFFCQKRRNLSSQQSNKL